MEGTSPSAKQPGMVECTGPDWIDLSADLT